MVLASCPKSTIQGVIFGLGLRAGCEAESKNGPAARPKSTYLNAMSAHFNQSAQADFHCQPRLQSSGWLGEASKTSGRSDVGLAQYPQSSRLCNCLGPAVNTELAMNIAGMNLDCIGGDYESRRDLLIG